MAFSWSTFFLEIVNFLVLVWILKRFLYQPVLNAIERRRSDVAGKLADAQRRTHEAEALQKRYEDRLSEWAAERKELRDALSREIAEQRTVQMRKLDEDLEVERQKALSLTRERDLSAQRAQELAAMKQGAAFVTRLLEGMAGPELHMRLTRSFSEELRQIPSPAPWSGGIHDHAVTIRSAYPLDRDTAAELEAALAGTLEDRSVAFDYVEDPQLLAGISVEIGGFELTANLRDELRAFAELEARGEAVD